MENDKWGIAAACSTGRLLLVGGAFLLGGMLSPTPARAEAKAKLGIGTGLAYGSPIGGAGAEIELSDRLSVLGGISGPTAEHPLSYGVRLYFHERDRRWRWHGSVFRWREGTGVYVGADHDVGGPSGLVLTYGLGVGDVNLEGRVGATFGIGYRF